MRVLFVDDDKQILRGLVRMLANAQLTWEIRTATSGQEAITLMETGKVDVLVTDMQMPGMDGAELLEVTSRRFPAVTRIVLSGEAKKEVVYRAVKPMHQYLAKPCDAKVLRATINRACELQKTLQSTRSHEFLGRISSLPSLPNIYRKVVQEIESEDGTLANVGNLIIQDPAMTAKVLQIVNSAMYGLRSPVTSPIQAVSILGMETLKYLTLSMQVFKSFEGLDDQVFSIEQLTRHSMKVAVIARTIAKIEELPDDTVNESFAAGLLHDLGKLVLAENVSPEYRELLQTAKRDSASIVMLERDVFGLGHDDVGSHLLALWALPQIVIEAVAFHHRPELITDNRLNPPALVYIANCIANEEDNRLTGTEIHVFEEFLQNSGVLDRKNVWRSKLGFN